jgi:anaerobic magnesium-protoporphyrin IX monomethyl ester cyclase
LESSANRVLLIYPTSDREETGLMPLSLLYIAQPLLENNIEVEILDQRFEEDFFGNLAKQLQSDLVCIGINCITGPHIEQVKKISDFVRERSNVPIVLGGPHPTLMPEQTLESGLVDYVVIKKGEAPFLKLVTSLIKNEPVENLEQVGSRVNGRIMVNRASLPGIDVRKVPHHLVLKYGKPQVIPIITSFGCPYQCSFCVERILHPKYSEIPLHDVLFMIKEALKLDPALINFIDDNFLLNSKRVMQLLSLCEQQNLNFASLCTGRVDNVLNLDDATLRFLKERGLSSIFFGIESGSSRILKLIKKKLTLEMVHELNQRLKQAGIIPHYSFMAGFPTETKQEVDKTIDLIRRLKDEYPQAKIWKINQYMPYPGTDLFDLAVEHGFKPPEKFEDWSFVHFYNENYSAPYDSSL